MMQAPIIGAFYNVANMYSLKLVVDAFGKSAVPEYSDLLYPRELAIDILKKINFEMIL